MATVTTRVRLSSRGQLMIPHDVRERLGLHPGDEVILHLLSDRVLVAEVAEPTPLQKVLARLDEEGRKRPVTPAEVERSLMEAREEVHRERSRHAGAA